MSAPYRRRLVGDVHRQWLLGFNSGLLTAALVCVLLALMHHIDRPLLLAAVILFLLAAVMRYIRGANG